MNHQYPNELDLRRRSSHSEACRCILHVRPGSVTFHPPVWPTDSGVNTVHLSNRVDCLDPSAIPECRELLMAPDTGLFDSHVCIPLQVHVHKCDAAAAHRSHGCRHSLEVVLSDWVSGPTNVGTNNTPHLVGNDNSLILVCHQSTVENVLEFRCQSMSSSML